jgi:hypothetical protein
MALKGAPIREPWLTSSTRCPGRPERRDTSLDAHTWPSASVRVRTRQPARVSSTTRSRLRRSRRRAAHRDQRAAREADARPPPHSWEARPRALLDRREIAARRAPPIFWFVFALSGALFATQCHFAFWTPCFCEYACGTISWISTESSIYVVSSIGSPARKSWLSTCTSRAVTPS